MSSPYAAVGLQRAGFTEGPGKPLLDLKLAQALLLQQKPELSPRSNSCGAFEEPRLFRCQSTKILQEHQIAACLIEFRIENPLLISRDRDRTIARWDSCAFGKLLEKHCPSFSKSIEF
jgi:hypothetical protein